MWSSGGDGFDGGYGGGADGGFMNSQAQMETPGQGEKKARRSQNLVPVTVKSIVDSAEDTMQIAGMDVHMITVVGLIRAVDVTSTKITYTIDDTTGLIDAVQWIDADQEGGDDGSKGPLMEMTYCRVAGSIRSHQGKRNLMVFRIVPITDLNFITTHILEVIHTQLKLQHIETLQSSGGMRSMSGPSGMMSNSLVGATGLDGGMRGAGSGGMSNMHGLEGIDRLVYQAISICTNNEGVSRDSIYSTLKGKAGHPQVDKSLEFLSTEGHIYSTLDDDHFKSTEEASM
ncbi:replication protein A 32 kDa subunit-A-like [Penaeus japonicus]|uniref:replication protein A 32 kDa subunit-A-like n=1 Tax=Penaeus japonicus TaxID=27405 RepID=UPI001C712009|nr:replication protein A 32 kDa subunit-A-like [Penaeus japonicus]